MDSVYSKFYTGNGSRYLSRSGSLPLFNTNRNTYNQSKPIVTPEVLKMQMMEERIKLLEKQKKDQNEQLNTLMAYQLNQNALHKSNSSILIPVSQPQPPQSALLLTANNVVHPLHYQNNLDRYYHLQNLQKNDYNLTSKTDNEFYHKKKHHHHHRYRSPKKEEDALKELLESQKIDKRINENLHSKIYKPIKNDLNNFMEEINYNIQKKMENDNHIVNSNINAVQNNYDEIRNILENKIDKMEQKQKMDFENLKYELENSAKNMRREQEEKEYNNSIYEMKMLELENQRKKEEKEKLFQSEIAEHINEEVRKQRELDEMKHQKELDELRRKHEIEDMENKKIMEELRFQRMRDGLQKKKYKIHKYQQPIIQQAPPIQQPIVQQYPMPFIYPMSQGNDRNTSDELFKLFMMKQVFGSDLFPQKKKKIKIKRIYDYPPKNYHYPPYTREYNQTRYYKDNGRDNKSISISNISSSELFSKSYKKHKHKDKDKKSKKSSSISESKSQTQTTKSKKSKKSKKDKKSKEDTSEQTKKDKKKKKKKDDDEDEDEEEEDEEDDSKKKKKKGKDKKKKKKGDDDDEDEDNEGGEEDDEGEGGEEDDEGEGGEEDDEGGGEGGEEDDEGEGGEEDGEGEGEGDGEGDGEGEGEGEDEEEDDK